MANSKWNSDNIPDQSGRVFIVTGATSGLGKEATRVLAGKGATVIMAVRNTQKGEKVGREITSASPGAKVVVEALDLSDLNSVKDFATRFLGNYDRLDVLINNAGVMMCPYSTTKDGFEIQMGTNHLGHFALTGLLMPVLKKTKGSRVVATSSGAHKMGKIDFGDLNWEKRKYNPMQAYSASKIANLYFAHELVRKAESDNQMPLTTSAHPGWTRTELQRHSGTFRFLNNFFSQPPAMGALPTLRAAIDPDAQPGDYYGPRGMMEMKGYPVKVQANDRSKEPEAARELWKQSEELTGVRY